MRQRAKAAKFKRYVNRDRYICYIDVTVGLSGLIGDLFVPFFYIFVSEIFFKMLRRPFVTWGSF